MTLLDMYLTIRDQKVAEADSVEVVIGHEAGEYFPVRNARLEDGKLKLILGVKDRDILRGVSK